MRSWRSAVQEVKNFRCTWRTTSVGSMHLESTTDATCSLLARGCHNDQTWSITGPGNNGAPRRVELLGRTLVNDCSSLSVTDTPWCAINSHFNVLRMRPIFPLTLAISATSEATVSLASEYHNLQINKTQLKSQGGYHYHHHHHHHHHQQQLAACWWHLSNISSSGH